MRLVVDVEIFIAYKKCLKSKKSIYISREFYQNILIAKKNEIIIVLSLSISFGNK